MTDQSTQSFQSDLIHHFLKNNLPTQLAGYAVAVATYFVLKNHADNTYILTWLIAYTLVMIFRIWMSHLGSKPQYNHFSSIPINAYVYGSFIAGVIWASLIFFFDDQQPLVIQVYILVILVGMPVASLPSNAVHLPTYYIFNIPIYTSLVVWPFIEGDDLTYPFLLAAISYIFLTLHTAINYHKNLVTSLKGQHDKQLLMSELTLTNKKLEDLAYIDPLTELANRRQFNLLAEQALQQRHRDDTLLAVILIDIDKFKSVNDTFGHKAGDELLSTIANRIKNSLRSSDAIARDIGAARIGGDEFIVLLENADNESNVRFIVERLIEKLCQPLTLNSNIDYHPRISVGIAIAPEHSEDIDELLHYADMAMYKAKHDQQGGYCFYSSTSSQDQENNA